jgi:hypothetical protein
VLYFYAAVGLIRYMFADHIVTSDELFAVGATFTLVVWGFAYVYLLVQYAAPGSFIAAVDPDVCPVGAHDRTAGRRAVHRDGDHPTGRPERRTS